MIRRVQHAGQWLFMHLEGGFNAFFGQALNPLYHLGAIAYFFFWLALGSGIYLYIFFDTGVKDAYDSVEQLTRQWYLGGFIRSIHRYASDGLVLAMLLHMVRHFTFDHYRNFRWFSWVTGVLLLWLIYASGINGYMLPWDRLAQFVTTATAEFLDSLPLFAGSLARNFSYREAVNDRLFTLLSFLHIGIPLGALIALWVHTQRVARAPTVPPRPIAIALAISMLGLAAVKPAVSQGPADLGAAVATVGLDWFYLPVFPLIYKLAPMQLGALLAGFTLLLFLVPWMPPRRAERAGKFNVTFRPSNMASITRRGETLLEAGLRQGVALNYDCRNGGCGVCKATLVHGSVDHGIYQKSVLSDEEKVAGKCLLCCASALSDLDVDVSEQLDGAGRETQTWEATVVSMRKLALDVMELKLQLHGEQALSYEAGQYVDILLDNGETRSYSFATAPGESELIEMHVRRIRGGKFTNHVFEQMREGDVLRFRGPYGRFVLREDTSRPIIFLAGATGFAPVKSMLEHAFRTGLKRRMYLYWGVRSRSDLYLADLPLRWQCEHPNFSFVPVLSEPQPEDQWHGRTGFVHEAVLEDFPELSSFELYACGSVEMIEAAHPAFLAVGLPEDQCVSDAFRSRAAPVTA